MVKQDVPKILAVKGIKALMAMLGSVIEAIFSFIGKAIRFVAKIITV